MSQQSWPAVQHCAPQQNSLVVHVAPLQGGSPQTPALQKGCVPPHLVPQLPQLWMSLLGLMHESPQHLKGCWQLLALQPPPELVEVLVVVELDELVVAWPLLDDVVVLLEVVAPLLEVVPVLVVFPELEVVPAPPPPPLPPALKLPPQPRMTMPLVPKKRMVFMARGYLHMTMGRTLGSRPRASPLEQRASVGSRSTS
jgi:hypothetical protein